MIRQTKQETTTS